MINDSHLQQSEQCGYFSHKTLELSKKKRQFLMDNIHDKLNISYNADLYFFSRIKDICNIFYQLFDEIDNYSQNTIYANLLSYNHAMGLVLKYKPESKIYVIKFYDPNCMSHYRLVFENKQNIKNLKLSSFIPNEATRVLYAMNYKNQDVMIAVYKNPTKYQELKPFNILNALKTEIEKELKQGSYENFILRLNNLINFTEQIDYISSIISSLNIVNLICDKYNDLELRFYLSEYFQIITNSNLTLENKTNLITSKSDLNKILITLSRHVECELKIKCFLQAIIGANLPKEFIMKFLEIDVVAINSADILKFYAKAIMASILEDHIVKALLSQNKSDVNAELDTIYKKLESEKYNSIIRIIQYKKSQKH